MTKDDFDECRGALPVFVRETNLFLSANLGLNRENAFKTPTTDKSHRKVAMTSLPVRGLRGNHERPSDAFAPRHCWNVKNGMCDLCVQISAIDAEIEKTRSDLQVQELIQRRRTLVEASVNDRHDPFTYLVPSEIVSHIFVSAIQKSFWAPRDMKTLPALAAVSRRWREIALSTPQLWTSLTIRPDCSVHVENPELLSEWIRRSGSLPLDISVHSSIYNRPSISPSEADLLPLIDALAECSDRWEQLDLRATPRFISLLRAKPDISCILVSLKIDPCSESIITHQGPTFDLGFVKPSPFVLDIDGMHFHSMNINWSNMYRLTTRNTYEDEYYEVLRQCPQLDEYDCLGLSAGNGGFPMPSTRISCTSLRTLRITDFHHPTFQLFDHLYLPYLEHLCWYTHNDQEGGLENLIGFVTSSNPPLQSLVVTHAAPEDALIRLIRLLHTLQDLHLVDCVISDTFFDLLASGDAELTDGTDGVHHPFLPFLGEVSITTANKTFSYRKLVPVFDRWVAAKGEGEGSYHLRPLVSFELRINNFDDEDIPTHLIDEDVLASILGYRKAGMEIVIAAGSYGPSYNLVDLSLGIPRVIPP